MLFGQLNTQAANLLEPQVTDHTVEAMLSLPSWHDAKSHAACGMQHRPTLTDHGTTWCAGFASAGAKRQDTVDEGRHPSQECAARLPGSDIPDAECRHVPAQALCHQQHWGSRLHLRNLQVGQHSSNGDHLRSKQQQMVGCKLHTTLL